MPLYECLVRAQSAATQRLNSEIQRLSACADRYLASYSRVLQQVPTENNPSGHDLTIRNTGFWTALTRPHAGFKRTMLLAADVFLRQGSPKWSRALLFILGLTEDNADVRSRYHEAEQADSDATADITAGTKLHDQGHFEEAINAYDYVLQRYPHSARARYEKGLSLSTLDQRRYVNLTTELCAEARNQDPFFGPAYIDPTMHRVFGQAVAPFLNGPRDRGGRMRFANGLLELGHIDLAALVWYTVLLEDLSQLYVRRPLVSCLRKLGLDEFLDTPGLPEPAFGTFESIRRETSARTPLRDRRVALRELQTRCQSLMDNGENDQALEVAREALALAMMLPRSDQLDVALAHNLVGAVLTRGGSLSDAEAHFRRGLELLQGNVLPENVELVVILNNLATNLIDQHRYPEARRFLQQAIGVAKDNGTLVAILIGSARVALKLGDADEADVFAKKAADAVNHGEKNEQTSLEVEALLADVALACDRPDEAVEHLELRLKRQRAGGGAEHWEVAVTLNNLARIHEKQGRLERAEELLRESLALRQRILGNDHADTATVHNNLGLLYAHQGRLAVAREHLEKALVIRQARLPPGHPYQPVTLQNLAEVEEALGEYDEALAHLRQAFAQDSALIGSMALGRTDKERSVLVAEAGLRSSVLVRLVMKHLTDRPAAVRTAVACIVARKGFLDGNADRPETARGGANYRSFATRLASLVLGGPRTLNPTEYVQAIEGIGEQLQTSEVERSGGAIHIPDAEAMLNELQRGIGDRVLLEYVRLEAPAGPAHKQSVSHYAAAVLSARETHLIDLGPASKIEKLIIRFREEMAEASEWVGDNERAAEARLKVTSRALHQLVFAPAITLLQDAIQIIVAPDSFLHLIPLGALIGPDDRYVVENLELAYVGADHDLLNKISQPQTAGAVCVIADPDFDLKPTHSIRAPQHVAHTRLSHHLATTRWTPLPASRYEADAIAKALTGKEVHIYVGDQATEYTLKSMSSPRILHIATHGYFLEDDDLAPLTKEKSVFEASIPAMLRSGLVFAGANNITQRSVSGEADKGLLSALEVSTLDLSNTELVVLSACETGVGAPLAGEGVLGLRRAFQQAGARQMVCALWKIPDLQSANLLRRFYVQLNQGFEPAQALHTACLETLRMRRAEGRAAHPLFWGAFIAIGRPHALSHT